MNGEGVDFSALTFLEKSASDNAGMFSVGIDLAGTGRSTAEIVGHANGAFLLELRGAKIKMMVCSSSVEICFSACLPPLTRLLSSDLIWILNAVSYSLMSTKALPGRRAV